MPAPGRVGRSRADEGWPVGRGASAMGEGVRALGRPTATLQPNHRGRRATPTDGRASTGPRDSERLDLWSGRPDLNWGPRGPKPRALTRLLYAPRKPTNVKCTCPGVISQTNQ